MGLAVLAHNLICRDTITVFSVLAITTLFGVGWAFRKYLAPWIFARSRSRVKTRKMAQVLKVFVKQETARQAIADRRDLSVPEEAQPLPTHADLLQRIEQLRRRGAKSCPQLFKARAA